MVHHSLNVAGLLSSEEHHQSSNNPCGGKRPSTRRLLFIPDIICSPADIQLCEYYAPPLSLFDQLLNEERVTILNRHLVKATVVLYWRNLPNFS